MTFEEDVDVVRKDLEAAQQYVFDAIYFGREPKKVTPETQLAFPARAAFERIVRVANGEVTLEEAYSDS